MQRISVVVRQRIREAVDLVARDRRTSASQAFEYLATVAAKEYKIDEMSALVLADQLAALDSSALSKAKRLAMLPESLLTPMEQYARDVLESSRAPESEAEAEIFHSVMSDTAVTGADVAFASSLWTQVRDAWANGAKTFKTEDEFGFGYAYSLNQEGDDVIVKMDHPTPHEEALTNIFASAGKQPGKKT
ncbi:MAG: hypothetical protein AB7E59_09280 [Pusillimonas sp.]